jgi:hypothetical protein
MNALEVFWEMLPGALPVFYVVLLAGLRIINLDVDFALKDATIISLVILVVSRVCNESKFFFEYHNRGSNDIVGLSLRRLWNRLRRAFGQSEAVAGTAADDLAEAAPGPAAQAPASAASQPHDDLRALQQRMHQLYVASKAKGSPNEGELLEIDSTLERLPWVGPDERHTHYFFFESQNIQAAYRSYSTGYSIVARSVPALLLIALVSLIAAIYHAQLYFSAAGAAPNSGAYSAAMLAAFLLASGSAWWMGTWAETIRYNRNLMQARLLLLLMLRDSASGKQSGAGS